MEISIGIIGCGNISDTYFESQIFWKARGKYARKRGAVEKLQPSFEVPIYGFSKLKKPITKELVHSKQDLETAIKASSILFGKSTAEDLKKLDKESFLEVFEGVPKTEISNVDFENGIDMVNLLAGKTNFIKSNGESLRALRENSISINKTKVNDQYIVSKKDLIDNQYILLQRGKKNYFIIKIIN